MDKKIDNWLKNFDIFDIDYVNNPFPFLDSMRKNCPITNSNNYSGSWMISRYEDLTNVTHNFETFSSSFGINLIPFEDGSSENFAIPLTADPPIHTESKKLITKWLTPEKVKEYEHLTQIICDELVQDISQKDIFDAAQDYARKIPVTVICDILSVDLSYIDQFTIWVNNILSNAYDAELRNSSRQELALFLLSHVSEIKNNRSDNFISSLFDSSFNDFQITGICASLFVAGIDTTWSSIGTILWHLATNPDDLTFVRNNIDKLPTMIEEFMRFYSPVNVARIATKNVEFNGCPIKKGDRIILNYTSANRDEDWFENADKLDLSRTANRHVAFGSGIHRCVGANLAKMEMRVAIETFLKNIPQFSLDANSEVLWAGGQVRGPRKLMIKVI